MVSQTAAPVAPPTLEQTPSSKSYATAVALSAVFGFIGVQHFYLRRWAEGLLDLALSIGWFWAFVVDQPLLAVALLIADFGHSFVVTIMLLTGSFKDGDGHFVCYPGQKIGRR